MINLNSITDHLKKFLGMISLQQSNNIPDTLAILDVRDFKGYPIGQIRVGNDGTLKLIDIIDTGAPIGQIEISSDGNTLNLLDLEGNFRGKLEYNCHVDNPAAQEVKLKNRLNQVIGIYVALGYITKGIDSTFHGNQIIKLVCSEEIYPRH